MQKAEDIFTKKSDIFELFRLMDQFKIIKKLTLNENQCFILKKTEKQTIISDFPKTQKEIEDLKEEKNNLKKEKLEKYLRRHNDSNSLTTTDQLLLKYADKSLDELDSSEEVIKENSVNNLNNHFE